MGLRLFTGSEKDITEEMADWATHKLNREIDSMLADDRRWNAPNWKRKYWGIVFWVFCVVVYLPLLSCIFYTGNCW
jgi:hypothetical protein